MALIGEATLLYLYFKKKRAAEEAGETEEREAGQEEEVAADTPEKMDEKKPKLPPPKPPPPAVVRAPSRDKPPKPPRPAKSVEGPQEGAESPSLPQRSEEEEKERRRRKKEKKEKREKEAAEADGERPATPKKHKKEKKEKREKNGNDEEDENAEMPKAPRKIKKEKKEKEPEAPEVVAKEKKNIKVEPEKEKKENGEENTEKEEDKNIKKEEHEGEAKEEEPPASRWTSFLNRSSAAVAASTSSMKASKDSATAAAWAKQAAAAEKIKATNAAAGAAVTAKREAAAAAAAAKKEAAAVKLKETQESIRMTKEAASEKISNTTAASKDATYNTAASVNTGFWSVVGAAKKAAVDTARMMPGQKEDTISIVHFNDVYNVESRDVEPVGGAARFLTAVKQQKDSNPLVLFSGDVFAPSIMSTFTKGEQMVPVLNQLGTHCAVYGNHDFDFGLDALEGLVQKTNFPWLISNVIDNETGRPLADGKVQHIIDWGGRKIGLIGLVEREWLDTLATINPEEVDYTDYVDAASMLATELKQKGCEYVIALTHMRTPNDIRLAESVPEVDLILGGHDHVYEKRKVNGTYILKSGTDFRQFSLLTLDFREDPVGVAVTAVDVTAEFEPDPELSKVLEGYSSAVDGKMEEVLGEFKCDLDGRFSSVRTAETNLGNLVTDIMVAALNADCALLNSGTLRSDRKHGAGEFLLRDLLSILPMMDELILLDVSGSIIHQALENGVSMWPKLEGRFPQVSGITFAFDPSKPPGSRVNPDYVKVGDEYLGLEQRYKLVTKAYIGKGKDGYDSLAQGEVLVDDEIAPNLTSAVQNHFKAIEMKQGKAGRKASMHHQSLVTLSRKTSVVKQLTEDGLIPPNRGVSPARSHSPGSDLGKGRSPGRGRVAGASVEQLESQACKLEPRLEGRILQLTPEVERRLKAEKEAEVTRLTITEVEELSSPDTPEAEMRSALFSTPGKNKAAGKGGKEEKSDLK